MEWQRNATIRDGVAIQRAEWNRNGKETMGNDLMGNEKER
jgi:hypothetical protein